MTQAQIDDGTAANRLQEWMVAHQADWNFQQRGNGVGTFGQYLEQFHQSKESVRPTINRMMGNREKFYVVGTQFAKDTAVSAVTAFFNIVAGGTEVTITPDVEIRTDGSWHVKMDLPFSSCDCLVRDPYFYDESNHSLSRRDGYFVRRLENAEAAFRWVPAWAFREFKSLQFKFVKSKGDKNDFVLNAIFPVEAPGGSGKFRYEHMVFVDGRYIEDINNDIDSDNDYYRIRLNSNENPHKKKKQNGIPCPWPVPVSPDEFLKNQKQIHDAMWGEQSEWQRRKRTRTID